MKNVWKPAFVLAAALCVFPACRKKESGGKELVIWTYDSFVSEWGPAKRIADNFAEKTGVRVRWDARGDAGALLSALLLEKENAKADIVLGLDGNLAPRALESGLFEAYRPENADKIFKELAPEAEDFRLIPYDYSYFAIIYDSEKIKNPPESLEDLTAAEYKKSLILMDPRTSSPGLGFLSWTIAVYGEDWPAYWERLRPSVLTIAAGWDSGYGAFTKGEAPLVLSYTTSPGYHLEYEVSERYRAALFKEGHPVQTELAGLLKAAPHKENARAFLDFMLTPGFQEVIPLTNWMYPVTDIELPESYRINSKPEKTLAPAPVSDRELNRWTAAAGG